MNFTKITSPSNPKIKEALDVKNKRGKYKSNAFIIEGPYLIEMALASGSQISKVFFTGEFASKKDGQKFLRQLAKKSIEINPPFPPFSKGEVGGFSGEIFEVTEQILNKLTATETPQGIIAIASYKPLSLAEITFKSIPLIVIADGIQEPGNLGTIIRTSDAAGADAVIIFQGTCDVFMQKTLRATAGSIFNIPIVYSETDELLRWLKTKKISLIATALNAETSIFDANLKKPLAVVFGNEAHGLSDEMKKNADFILKIPLLGKAESLNVSSAAAVCLYEAIRQRLQIKI